MAKARPATTQAAARKAIATSKGKGTAAEAGPNDPNLAYKAMETRWTLVSDLLGGTPAMQAAGDRWLRPFPNEKPKEFQKRVDATILFNAFGNTVQTLVGRVFSEPITFTDQTDPRVLEWAKNIDLQGRDITAYGRDCLSDMLAFGKCHTMPEFPNVEKAKEDLKKEKLTLAEDRKLNIRPFFSKVHPLNLIAWNGVQIGGVEQLSRIRIRDHGVERVGDWGEKPSLRVRVVEPNEVQLYKEQESGKKQWVKDGAPIENSIGLVNLTTAYAKRIGLLMSAPPLEDLAWLNVHHWRSSSDQDNILHVVRAAILFLAGFTEEDVQEVQVGASRALYHRDPNAKMGYVEHGGTGIEAGRQDLQDTKEEMGVMGAGDMLQAKPGNETATARAIDEGRSISSLEAAALELGQHLEDSFKMAGLWIDEPDLKVGVRVNTDFGTLDNLTAEMTLIQKDADAGRIDTKKYLEEGIRRGLYDSETDVDKVMQDALDALGNKIFDGDGGE